MVVRALYRTSSTLADTMANMPKASISSLPLPPSSHTLTKNLTPDPLIPSPALHRNIQREKPSIQRRARLLDPAAHFSYVSPFPSPFPYKIAAAEGSVVTDQAALIEEWLAAREPLHDKTDPDATEEHLLKKYYQIGRAHV